ncbi:MAG TPA: hypothetical protein VMS71_04760, partial [Candidatus Acidoferrum sp.]|nr:hypothetical protein [Candidatus Acidoferrum sp.]
IDVAAGVTYVQMTSTPSSTLDLGHQLVFGLIARSPVIGNDRFIEGAKKFFGRVAVGTEWSMLGTGTHYAISQFAPPAQARLGIGLELGYAWLRMYPAAEVERVSGSDMEHWRYGAELIAFDIMSLRGGFLIEPAEFVDIKSYGLTLSSLGITKRLASKKPDENVGLGDYLSRHLNVKFSFANLSSKDGWYPDGVKYYAISVSL